ncbi:hypothetical protein E2C01_027240 [Portunus trituberculatus]|uniref:Uncharacterized protein n=1 Tax=Portunus trituberculatus TaxID=210409 RepID=A0A5B7EI84_PORTR|nr:hypothetical protein [Portunus trituberculatus]
MYRSPLSATSATKTMTPGIDGSDTCPVPTPFAQRGSVAAGCKIYTRSGLGHNTPGVGVWGRREITRGMGREG